jgi:hypothetical protein
VHPIILYELLGKSKHEFLCVTTTGAKHEKQSLSKKSGYIPAPAALLHCTAVHAAE